MDLLSPRLVGMIGPGNYVGSSFSQWVLSKIRWVKRSNHWAIPLFQWSNSAGGNSDHSPQWKQNEELAILNSVSTQLAKLLLITTVVHALVGFVMKYFMQYRAEVAGAVILPQAERLALLHNNKNIKELRYMLSMVDLLSTCAEVCFFHKCSYYPDCYATIYFLYNISIGYALPTSESWQAS